MLCFGATIAGCTEDPELAAEAAPFENGVATDTDGGAFRVVLISRRGLGTGTNDLIARVGFHDQDDPEDPGRGIPNADVRLDAHMLDGDGYIGDLQGSYLGDGRYEFNDFELAAPGVWQLELSIAVGETIDESAAFVFEIAE